MLDDRLIAFSSTFALLCAVILARVVFMRQPRRLVLAGVTLLPGGASGWYILIAGPRDVGSLSAEAARSDGQGAVSPHSPPACRARRGSEA